MGLPYDGAGSPCYRPPGPFWCWLPGPCSTCRDPWLRYYEERYADCIGRHVCNDCDPKEGIIGYVPPEWLPSYGDPMRMASREEADDGDQ
jgi:hypothetical protein